MVMLRHGASHTSSLAHTSTVIRSGCTSRVRAYRRAMWRGRTHDLPGDGRGVCADLAMRYQVYIPLLCVTIVGQISGYDTNTIELQ